MKNKTNKKKKKKTSPDELITLTVETGRNNHALEGGTIERLDPEKIDLDTCGAVTEDLTVPSSLFHADRREITERKSHSESY